MKFDNFEAIVEKIHNSLSLKDKNVLEIDKEFLIVASSIKTIDVIGIYYFFFPAVKTVKNSKTEFWFEKYKDEKSYTEYSFAFDLLVNLKQYLKNRDEDTYVKNLFDSVNKFKSYKNIDLYFFFTKDIFKEIVYHITAFLHHDITYFKSVLNIDIKENDDFSDILTIKRIFFEPLNYNKLINTNLESMQNEINKLSSKINEDKIKTEKIIAELYNNKIESNEKIEKLNKDILEINQKIDKIYLRDTLKYSIKYIYRMFFAKYGQGKIDNSFSGEVAELKRILKEPELKGKYNFLYNFIDNVSFSGLSILNRESHPLMNNRNFDDINKYLPNNSGDLNKAVNFIKNLPNIENYINLEITFFLNKETLEKKINENYDFSKIFEKVISAESA